MDFTFEEVNLMCIYNTGTRQGLIDSLTDMRKYLQADEAELRSLTDSALHKLNAISDDEYETLELVPDFE